MTKIALLGLGAMGSRIAANLIESGFDLTVWNRDVAKAQPLADKGAKIAATPRAAAISADIVIAMLRDDDAATEVWLDAETGALAAMRPGAIAVESSTLTLGAVQRLHAAAQAHGVGFVDAPVAGSRPQAQARQLIYLAGGEAAAIARVEPVLKANSAAIHHAGPVGAGMALKLAVNALFAAQVAACAEILAMLERQGVRADRAAEIIGATPVASPAAKGAMASMAAAAYAPQFPVELAAKDMAYATAEAAAAGINAHSLAAVAGVFAAAVAGGLGGEHLTAVRKLL